MTGFPACPKDPHEAFMAQAPSDNLAVVKNAALSCCLQIVNHEDTMLIIFGGLPGVGKTTLAKALAREWEAVYLRVDTIEQALRFSETLQGEVGPAGYLVAYRLAEENLHIGRTVVADSVNPLSMTRDAWLLVAANASKDAIEIEVICSDPSEHRRRVETRNADIDGLSRPTWQAVLERTYEDWTRPHLVLDTAKKSIEVVTEELFNRLKKECRLKV